MSDDLTTSLRVLAAGETSDVSVAVYAAIEIERLREENGRLYRALYRIAGKVPFADDPWTIARDALEDGR